MVNVILTGALVLVTAFYAWATYRILKANERVVEVMVGVNIVLLFDVKQEIAALVVGFQFGGFAEIAFAKRRVLEQLAEIIAVSTWCKDRPIGLDE